MNKACSRCGSNYPAADNQNLLNYVSCCSKWSQTFYFYFSNDGVGVWHFFRTSVMEKLQKYKENSEVLDRMLGTKNKLPFMN